MGARGTGTRPDLVDEDAIAARLGVHRSTAVRRRVMLPPPDLRLGATDLWLWETVRDWDGSRRSLVHTGRRAPIDVVDVGGLAARLEVSPDIAAGWHRLRVLPDPDYRWTSTEAWLWSTIEQWAAENAGRVAGLGPPTAPAVEATPPGPDAPTGRPVDPAEDAGRPGTMPIRPVSRPPTPQRARVRSIDPIGDLDRIGRYFAGVAGSLREASGGE